MRPISDSSSPATMMALTPWWVRLECASWPVTSVEKVMALLWALTTFIEVGSPTMTARGFGRLSRRWATSGRTPLQPTSSSQDKARWMGDVSPALRKCGTSARQTARKPFMSQVPRPKRRSSRAVSSKGSLVQGWPSTGTTSVWPDSTMPPAMAGPMVANRLVLRLAS